MIREFKAETFVIRCYCDDCDTELQFKNINYTDTVQFVHTCPKCDKNYVFEEKYPTLGYKQM